MLISRQFFSSLLKSQLNCAVPQSISSCGYLSFPVFFPHPISPFLSPHSFFLSFKSFELEWRVIVIVDTVEQNSSAQHPLLVKMPEIQLGAHTLRSHGVQVARIHMHDWLILLLLVIIDIVLNVIEPFHRFVGKNMMEDLMYPFKGNTVPFWAVPIIAILLPFLIILIYYFIRKDVYDFHQAILGLLFSVLITSVITDAIKDGVGRPRPDFFWRCFPDGKGVFNNVTGLVQCTGLKSDIKEGHKSFPSGHSSWSFAGLGFLAWYLGGKIRVFDRRGHVAKLCLVLSPILLAAMVAVSRVDDYWHHWQDVFAGGLLGMVISSFCYLQFFPAPYETDGWGPHAYFHMLEASRNGLPTTNTNALSVRPTEMENVSVQSHHDPDRSEFDHYPSMPNPDGAEGGMRL